jgi:cytoplasmic iron level regulating protein YaaA (DUF328/UPF0246 family)
VLTVISPAKSLDFETPLPTRKHSDPTMLDEAEQLVAVMATKSPEQISKMMGISPQLGELNFERFQSFEQPFTLRNARPALLAFTGDVYLGMDPRGRFGERDYTHAQKTLRILSGLYGLLRPLDLIQPYRLEMGSKVATARGRDLYDFWNGRITDVLNADVEASPGTAALINLASNEYFGVVQPDRVEAKIISPVFLDWPADKPGNSQSVEPRIVSFFAKRARGAMAGWLIRNRINSVRAIREFDEMGYSHDPARSTSTRPVFVR